MRSVPWFLFLVVTSMGGCTAPNDGFADGDGVVALDGPDAGDDAAPETLTDLGDAGAVGDAGEDLAGPCVPGDQRVAPCGNCGMRVDTCNLSRVWIPGVCDGQGPCAPGEAQPGTCDPCSVQTCGLDCKWSACTLKPGNACEYQGGAGMQACPRDCSPRAGFGHCIRPAIQTCRMDCQWESACLCVASESLGLAECR